MFNLLKILININIHINIRKNSVEFSFKDTENLNMEKDYYNDLPGKLPPELLDPVEEIPPHSQPTKKLSIQVSIVE